MSEHQRKVVFLALAFVVCFVWLGWPILGYLIRDPVLYFGLAVLGYMFLTAYERLGEK